MELHYCQIIANDISNPQDNNFYAEDNIQTERAGKWNKQELTYAVIQPTQDITSLGRLNLAVNVVMTMWDIELNLNLKPVSIYSQPDIRIIFRSSAQDEKFRESPSTLAYAYYPEQGNWSGIIVVNDDYYWNLDGAEIDAYLVDPIHYKKGDGVKIRGYNLIAVLGHEFGHTLGLTHSITVGDLMLPYYDRFIKWISKNDIARALLKYPAELSKGVWYNSRMRAWIRRRITRFGI